MNVLYISHCDVTGHSANHVFHVAGELRERGIDPVVAIPRNPHSAAGRGDHNVSVVYYDEAAAGLAFPDGRGPDLIHAWTPREHVRKLADTLIARYGCPYVVHLEDNEDAITADEWKPFPFAEFAQLPGALLDEIVPWNRHHPRRAHTFLQGASGMTVLIDRLLEFKPAGIPGVVFWPGFDRDFLQNTAAVRDDAVVVYTGNIHESNQDEVTSLILAIGILNRRGRKIQVIKTGSNLVSNDIVAAAKDAGFLVDMGIVPRAELPGLLQRAHVLVQPGRPGPFNDYRFPSKVPEFLATGKPVILPATNIGLVLQDGVECVHLEKGDALDIAEKLESLLTNPARMEAIGRAGKAFAIDKLDWSRNVAPILDLYRTLPPGVSPVNEVPAPFLVRLVVETGPLPACSNYLELAMNSIDRTPNVRVHPSDLYTKWLAATIERTIALREVEDPVITLQGCPENEDAEWLQRTQKGLANGIANYLRNRGLPVLDSQVERYVAKAYSW